MKRMRLQISPWWKDATSCTFGAIVGIVLTVGITFWQQEGDRKEMTRKITKITLHNLDVRIKHVQEIADIFTIRDSIYKKLQAYTPDQLDKLPEDSLLGDLNRLITTHYPLTDTKSETIFSHSFEVWQYLEDEKVIGRISNCYSMTDFGEKLADEWEKKFLDATYSCQLKVAEQGLEHRPAEIVRIVTRNPEMKVALGNISATVYMLNQLATVATQLNECNKLVLNLSQEELEEIGNLLEQNTINI